MRFALLLLVACACAPRACAMIDNTRHLVAGCSWGPHYVGQLQGITVHVAPDCPKFDTGTLLRAFEAAGPRGVGVNGPGWETAAWLGVQEPLRAWYPACAVVMPSRETLAILDFKDAFSVWMASHADLAPHTPATFASLDDAVYPLFLKLDVHALGSQGINLVQTRAEAEALLAAHPGTQPHLLQEAILSVDEWSIKFVAFQGRLLQIGQCILRHDSKTLAIMQPGADKAIRSQVNCTAMPEAVQVLSLLDNIVVLSNFSGIGNLQFKVAESGVVKVIEMPGGFDTLAHFVHLWVDAYELANGLNSSRVFMD